MVAVLDAMGYQRVLIETVGVGQDEVDIMRAAHTTVVVTVPGLGDDIQAIKAGLLEVADVLCINKADREGADRTERDLLHMLDLRADGDRKSVDIVRTVATRGPDGSSIPELAAAIERHRHRAWTGAEGAQRARQRASAQVAELVRALVADRADAALAAHGGLGQVADEVLAHRMDPYSAAEAVLARA